MDRIEWCNKYRWYLCVETSTHNWKCKQVTAEQALDPFTCHDGRATMALPVSRLLPEIIDKAHLRHVLKPAVDIVVDDLLEK
jgi:hypothetical protein